MWGGRFNTDQWIWGTLWVELQLNSAEKMDVACSQAGRTHNVSCLETRDLLQQPSSANLLRWIATESHKTQCSLALASHTCLSPSVGLLHYIHNISTCFHSVSLYLYHEPNYKTWLWDFLLTPYSKSTLEKTVILGGQCLPKVPDFTFSAINTPFPSSTMQCLAKCSKISTVLPSTVIALRASYEDQSLLTETQIVSSAGEPDTTAVLSRES